MHRVIDPVFQPIVNIHTECPVHYELLMRTRNRENGHQRLVQLAESYGFQHVVDMAMIRHCQLHLAQHADCTVAVNVSVASIEAAGADIVAALTESPEASARIIVEITETIPVALTQRIRWFADALREHRIRIALDDYGMPNFGNELVEQLSPEYVKLDGELVNRAVAHGAHLLGGILERVAGIGGAVIAERVDTERKKMTLRDWGVGYAQGALFGMPCSWQRLSGASK